MYSRCPLSPTLNTYHVYLSDRFPLPALYAIGILLFVTILIAPSCDSNANNELLFEPMIIEVDPEVAAERARAIREEMSAVQLLDGFELSLWASDSLSPDPIALAIDQQGRAYITRTNRQKNSEFDIRNHRDWMTASITLQSVEDRRQFLRTTFAPERSEENDWLPDLNGDGSHDWRDLTVEKEQVFRIEDRNRDGVADYAQLYMEGFNEEITDVAGAVLPYPPYVYVGVGPDMWRLRDYNNDGMADFQESISHGYAVHIGFGGHGMSGLKVGPDGKIYWGIGDIGMNVTDKDGRQWSYPNQGVIVRANPDGSDFEVFAAGLRNTHEFAFDDYGNLITVDNDGDHPGESERLVYIVNGSDSGWRTNWQFGKYTDPDNNDYKVWMDEGLYLPRFEGQAAYITPPIRNYHNGPTGMLYNPGTALTDSLREHFFMVEFTGSPARSNIYAFRLKPKGAGFEFRDEKRLVNGVLATGLDFGPDGALYFADWLDGWDTKNRGRIWKLDDPKAANSPLRRETQELIAADFTSKYANELISLLSHPDRRVRYKAQFTLARRGNVSHDEFVTTATQTADRIARIHAIWGIGQLARKQQELAEPLIGLLDDEDAEIRAQAAKVLGEVHYEEAADALMRHMDDDEPRVRFFLTEALGRLAYEPAIDPIVGMLEDNKDEDVYLRHAGSLALARIGKAEPILALADHPSRALRIAAVVALRRMQHPGVAQFLQDEDEYIVTEAARAINDDHSIKEAMPALARLLRGNKSANEALVRRIINANSRIGEAENLSLLAEYAARQDAPEALRAEAVAALGVWAKPSVLDRVDGRYRGAATRDSLAVREAMRPLIPQLLKGRSDDLRAAAAIAVGKLQLTSFADDLDRMVRSRRPAAVRIAALEGLAALGVEQTIPALQLALKDAERDVRVSALRLLPEQDLPADELLSLFEIVLQRASIREQQTALRGLSDLPVEKTRPLLNRLLDQLMAGEIPPGIQLELIEAVEESKSQPLLDKLAAYRAGFDENDILAQYREALDGGNPWRGRQLFLSHETSQCVRCHTLEPGKGSDVGPSLADVGAKYSREELLKSLVAPSESITPGYGVVVLTLRDGRTISGIVKEENDKQLVLQIGQAAPQTIAKSDIEERIDANSSMPPMGDILSKEELRDIVAFLAGLGQAS